MHVEKPTTSSVAVEFKRELVAAIGRRFRQDYGGAKPFGALRRASDSLDLDLSLVYELSRGSFHRYTIEYLLVVAAKAGIRVHFVLEDVNASAVADSRRQAES